MKTCPYLIPIPIFSKFSKKFFREKLKQRVEKLRRKESKKKKKLVEKNKNKKSKQYKQN